MFCIAGDDGFFDVVVGVGLVSIIKVIVSVFPTSAEQTCEHDKMKHFLEENTTCALKAKVRSQFSLDFVECLQFELARLVCVSKQEENDNEKSCR